MSIQLLVALAVRDTDHQSDKNCFGFRIR